MTLGTATFPKDGDLVEVDAEKGVVRVVKRAAEQDKFHSTRSRSVATREDVPSASQSSRIKLADFGTREFTLAFMDLLFRSEKRSQVWLGGAKPPGEYFAAEYVDGLLHIYMEPDSLEWVRKKVAAQHAAHPDLVDQIIKNTKQSVTPFLSILKVPHALDVEEFRVFLNGTSMFWSWLSGMWWLTEAYEGKEQYRDEVNKLLQLRKDTDYVIPAVDKILKHSFLQRFPNLKELSTVVTFDEFFAGRHADIRELKERFHHSLILDSGVYIGPEIDKRKSRYVFEVHAINSTNGTVTGIIAMKGTHQGIVRVVQRLKDVNKVQKGDVLVASTTLPEWMFGLQLAGAIVTDEGGILSHAAIISRELKKPCIIGTKIATQVLKDGDLVEVDAEKGVITVVGRNG